MPKIERYYVDSDGHPDSNIVIRDRVSPLIKQIYPTDIVVEVTMGMFKNRQETISIANKICALLNQD